MAGNQRWYLGGCELERVAGSGHGDTATFNGAGNSNLVINLNSGVTINTVIFDTSSAAAYTIGSGLGGKSDAQAQCWWRGHDEFHRGE